MLSQAFYSTPQNAAPVKIPELGLELTVRLPAQALGGAMTLMETVNAAGFGPPLHRHREAEVFRVMEGAYLFEVDGSRFQAQAGDPDFLHEAPNRFACAAFGKESRMEFANANKLDRKSGGRGLRAGGRCSRLPQSLGYALPAVGHDAAGNGCTTLLFGTCGSSGIAAY